MNNDGSPNWKLFIGRLIYILMALWVIGVVPGYFHKQSMRRSNAQNYKSEFIAEHAAKLMYEADLIFDQMEKEKFEKISKAVLQEMADKHPDDLSAEVVKVSPPADQAQNSAESNP